MNLKRFHYFGAAAGCALALLALWPILFRPGLPAYQQDWSWPFDAHTVLTGAFNHLSTWNPAGLGSPNALASNNVLHLLIALPALVVSGSVAGKVTLGASAALAALLMYFASVRIMRAGPLAALAASVLYATLPVFLNKIGAGHVAYWIAYALLPLLLERSVRYAEAPSAKIFAQIALLSIACTLQIQFAVFGLLVVAAGAARGGFRAACMACCASLAGSALILIPTAYAFESSQSYINVLYLPPRLTWENGMSAALPGALWMTKYVVPYFNMASWPNEIALIVEVAVALVLAVFASGRRRLMLLFLVLAGLFFTTGTLGPAAAFWKYAFTHWPAATVFRETYNANALLALAYGLGIAASTRFRFMPLIALICAMVTALPLFLGGVARAVPNVTFPQQVQEQRMLTGFAEGRVVSTPFDSPMLLENRGPGGLDIGAVSDDRHPAMTEYPTLFPLTVYSLTQCYCEPWFTQAMRHAGVTGMLLRPHMSSADLTRQHVAPFQPTTVQARTVSKSEPLVSFATRAIEQPLSFDALYDANTAGLTSPAGPLPQSGGSPAIALPSPDRRQDDPRLNWVSIARWYAYSADPHASAAYGVATVSRAPLTIQAGAGPWYVLYAAVKPLDVRIGRAHRVLAAAAHPRWALLPGGGIVTFTGRDGKATVFRLARGSSRIPAGRYTGVHIERYSRTRPWRVDLDVTPAAGTALLIFRERYSPEWRVEGAQVLWHGVADGYANAFVLANAGRDLHIIYSPQHGFFVLTYISWALQGILLLLALPLGNLYERRIARLRTAIF